jgi:hypothetical protein
MAAVFTKSLIIIQLDIYILLCMAQQHNGQLQQCCKNAAL